MRLPLPLVEVHQQPRPTFAPPPGVPPRAGRGCWRRTPPPTQADLARHGVLLLLMVRSYCCLVVRHDGMMETTWFGVRLDDRGVWGWVGWGDNSNRSSRELGSTTNQLRLSLDTYRQRERKRRKKKKRLRPCVLSTCVGETSSAAYESITDP